MALTLFYPLRVWIPSIRPGQKSLRGRSHGSLEPSLSNIFFTWSVWYLLISYGMPNLVTYFCNFFCWPTLSLFQSIANHASKANYQTYWSPLLKGFVIRKEKTILGILSSSSTMNVVLFSCLHLFHWSPTSCGECRKIQSSHPKPWQVIEYIDQKLQKIQELKSEAKAKHGLMLETECMVLIPTCNICFRSQINTWEASVFLMVKSNVQLQKSFWGNFWSM